MGLGTPTVSGSEHPVLFGARAGFDGSRQRPPQFAIIWLPAISNFESWPIRNVTTPAMIGQAASATRPSVVSPVASLIQPMAYGPTKPPRLPIEFINAMPPAAAEPVRKPVGSVQKVVLAAYTPIAQMVRATAARRGLPK